MRNLFLHQAQYFSDISTIRMMVSGQNGSVRNSFDKLLNSLTKLTGILSKECFSVGLNSIKKKSLSVFKFWQAWHTFPIGSTSHPPFTAVTELRVKKNIAVFGPPPQHVS